MDELLLNLEAEIKALMQKYEQQHQATAKLKQEKSMLLREKDVLLSKQKSIATQIENMVLRLKSLEKTHDEQAS